jgi:hypothetical protein
MCSKCVFAIKTVCSTQMLLVFEEAEKKNKTLASWTKERVEQVSRIAAMWDNFQAMLDNHQYILSKQVCFVMHWYCGLCILKTSFRTSNFTPIDAL